MPKKKVPLPLKSCCLKSIVSDFDKYVNYYSVVKICEDAGKLFLENLEFLRQCFNEELLLELKYSKSLKFEYLEFLITGNMKTLNLSGCKWLCGLENLSVILKFSGQKLTELNLHGCLHIPVPSLVEIVKAIPAVISLKLRNTLCTDIVISYISMNCPCLQLLDVDCCSVGDAGLLSLCNLKGEATFLNIKELSVCLTNAKDKVIAVILKHFRNLTVVHYRNLSGVLCDLYFMNNSLSGEKIKYVLEEVIVDENCNYSCKEQLNAISELCPYLKIIKIHCQNFSDGDILLLKKFNNLQEIHFNLKNSRITLNSLVNIMKVLGPRLTCLSFDFSISLSNIIVLGFMCPQLHSLSINNISRERRSMQNTYLNRQNVDNVTKPFNNVKSLKISNISEELPHCFYHLLQLCTNLDTLYLSHIRTLSNECFHRILDSGALQSLTELQLHFCEPLSTGALKTLTTRDNTLQHLIVYFCKNVTGIECDELQKQSLRNNFDLKITYYKIEIM